MSSNLYRSWSSRFLGEFKCQPISRRLLLLSTLLMALIASGVSASPRVAVVGGSARWCELLVANGYQCDNLPETGPDGPLEAYDVVINIGWRTDPDGLLADFMRAGGGVITFANIPLHLGIETDPTVQAWIGANVMDMGGMELLTTVTDPILGDIPVGTELMNCAAAECSALADTSGHPDAKILADFPAFGTIGVLRNSWEGGQSVYLTEVIYPGAPLHDQIILNAVRILAAPPIPAVSDWSLAIMTLLILSAGSIVLLRRGPPRLRRV